MTAEAESRSYYLEDYADEVVPCDCSLDGWATWLAKPDPDWNRHEAAENGASFKASAILWGEDIIATRSNGDWSLSREPADDEFVAIRFSEGLGWDPENIVTVDMDLVGDKVEQRGTLGDALRKHLKDMNESCDDVEHIATGFHESDWLITFHEGPPAFCKAARIS